MTTINTYRSGPDQTDPMEEQYRRWWEDEKRRMVTDRANRVGHLITSAMVVLMPTDHKFVSAKKIEPKPWREPLPSGI